MLRKHGTLVITKISKFGIVMVADTAITIDNRPFVGYQKLFPIPHPINAGISIWGNLDIRGTDADEWIRYFINNELTADMRLWNIADKLTKKLNSTFGDRLIREHNRMGMHVAGFDKKDDIYGPALYAINNGDYKVSYDGREFSVDDPSIENPPVREFSIDAIYPHKYEGNQQEGRKNGDFGIYDYLIRECIPIFDGLKQYNFIFPCPSLETLGEYYRFWVNFVKEVYRLSNKNERVYGRIPPNIDYMHIGGPVSVLTISDKGINSFYTI